MAPRARSPIEVRLMGVGLVVLWVGLATAIAASYRPGGPLDVLVVAACFLPSAIAAIAIVWPAVPGSARDRLIVVWIWIVAVILAAPLLHSVSSSLAAGGAQSLVPSAEIAYGGLLALGAMCAFSLLGLTHARRDAAVFRREATIQGGLLALAVTSSVALVFGGVFLINDAALRTGLPSTSRFGPTEPELIPPPCDEAVDLGPDASVTLNAVAAVEDRAIAQATLSGQRSGLDEAWSGAWRSLPAAGASASPDGEAPPTPSDVGARGIGAGELAYRRVGAEAWLNLASADLDAAGTTWQPVAPDPFGLAGPEALTMDGPPQAVVGGHGGPIVAEDLGLEVIEGARARHCRMFVDGPTALATFLPLRWLVSGSPVDLPTELPNWRGELDWWVFSDGQLGRATVSVSGLRSDAWPRPPGIRGSLDAQLDAVDRTQPVEVADLPAGSAAARGALQSAAP